MDRRTFCSGQTMIRKLWERGRGLLDRAVSHMLRPYVGRLVEELVAKLEFEGRCEDEDIPDCANCPHHGDCPWEPGTIYNVPAQVVFRLLTPPDKIN